MKEFSIFFNNSVEKVSKFVSILSQYPDDIQLTNGGEKIDAQSLIGIFSMDISKPIRMIVNNNNCDDLLVDVQEFLFAE